MIIHQGVYLPDGEKHLVEWMTSNGEIVDGKGTYQIKKLRAALGYCTQFRTAVDVGAHCGLWSMQLVKRFVTVRAFEPVAAHRECFLHNIVGTDPVAQMQLGMMEIDWDALKLHACALGSEPGAVSMRTAPTSSGDTCVGGAGDIPMLTLDSFQLRNVDFVKIDCEGYELNVLRGGEGTIRRCRPVIIVEQKPGRAHRFGLGETEAVDYLRGLDYELAREMSGDFIMVTA